MIWAGVIPLIHLSCQTSITLEFQNVTYFISRGATGPPWY